MNWKKSFNRYSSRDIKVDKLWIGNTPGRQFLIEWVPSSKKLKVTKVDPPT
jgi:hypothetical protein